MGVGSDLMRGLYCMASAWFCAVNKHLEEAPKVPAVKEYRSVFVCITVFYKCVWLGSCTTVSACEHSADDT